MSFKAIVYIPLLFYSFVPRAQSSTKKIQRAWIKLAVENLSSSPVSPDTLYTRYSFDREKVNLSFYPAWNDYSFAWSLTGNSLTIGYETYLLEELTDSTLIFSKDNFRRFRFVSETVYKTYKSPDTTTRFNDQPVYVANNYLTPRYKKENPLHTFITTELEKKYNVKHQNTLVAKFIVTSLGKIENVRIINGLQAGFDNEFIKLIKKTTGDWYPAKIGDTPVNCEMTYTIKYLDSLDPNLDILDGRIII